MKEKVILQVSGLHSVDGNNDSVEMIHSGRYGYVNGKHCIKYQESLDDGIFCDNIIKISPNEVEFVRRGAVSTDMIFTMGEKHLTYYETPFGAMTVGIDTSELDILQMQDSLTVDIRYALELNYEYMSDCHVQIKVVEEKA